jgi:5-carboxyvanillate decarboxylase
MTELKIGGSQGYLRIATEEAFITPEVLSAYKHRIAGGSEDPGFLSLWVFYSRSPPPARMSLPPTRQAA